MKIKKLRAKGFVGFNRGLGLDTVEIDFSGVSGLVAFAGVNGSGKSTCIELLSPWNRLASRSGALYQHVYLRDSERELSFSYQGHDYRTLLKIDSQSGKSEGFIWRDGESLVNGKISAYSKAVTELFGSSELFYNSVFCQQNATKLSDMTTGQLKTLFAEFLRLDRLQEYEEICKQKNNVLSGKVAQIDTTLDALRKRMDGAQGIKEELARLNVLKEEKEGLKTDLNATLLDVQKEREKLKEVIAKNEVLKAQANSMTDILNGMIDGRHSEGKAAEESLNVLRTQYQELSGEIQRIEAILKDEAAIYAAVENEKALKELIESITLSIDEAAKGAVKEQAIVTGLEKEIQELKNQCILPEKDAEYQSLCTALSLIKQNIKAREDQLAALDIRDQDCTSKTCSFIVTALKAKDELPALEHTLRQHEAAREKRANELINAGAAIGRTIAEKEGILKQAKDKLINQQFIQISKRKELADRRLDLSRYQNLAAKQAEIAVAKSKKEDRAKALEENKKQGMAIAEAWKARKQALDDQIIAQQNKIAEINGQIEATAAGYLTGIEDHIKETTTSIDNAEKLISEITTKIATLQAELSGIYAAEEQLKKATDEQSAVMADMADWTYIRNACGKNGLQAMEIDGAAPLITGYANELLSKAFGSLYTVKFLTQDENGKECLDIVTIGEDGEEVLLDNLSGGQKVWILMALRLAMTLLSKEKGGRNFQTAFFDELDGSLDSENAVNFISMYRAFMEIGHFETIPFISHKQECRSMADHVLMFEPGKVPYWC
ncbi:MAG: SMC family ATPase [Deltaproteobacteria bacterium]|nr:SMC family ATPase [Deltaproteobacteria bacterium]